MTNDDLLDRIKLKIFTSNKIQALFGPLMCNITWEWSYDIPTASTNYKKIIFNPDFMSSMPIDLAVSIALHEMNHVFRLHDLRIGDRNPKLWNIACDYVINFHLAADGFTVGSDWLHDPALLEDNNLESEEDVYDHLIKDMDPDEAKCQSFGNPDEDGDMEGFDGSPTEKAIAEKELVDAVASAVTQANMSGEPGNISEEVRQYLEAHLNPVIPWNVALRKYFIEAGGEVKNTWSRRNRRFPNIYMPKRVKDNTQLTKVMFFLDTSGSVTDEELMNYLAEIRFVQENLKPLELQVIQFDHQIQNTEVYRQGDKIGSLEVVGRGGTNLGPVLEQIQEAEPTVVVIFSDLECQAMEDPKVPVIWITQETPYSWKPDYGNQFIIK